jgi:hypothetical protein
MPVHLIPPSIFVVFMIWFVLYKMRKIKNGPVDPWRKKSGQ